MARISGSGTRLLVVALLLITAGPWAPVLCYASGHLEVEMPYAACCGIHGGSASQTTRDPLLRSVSSGCGDCTDIPLVSVWPPESVQMAVTLEAAQASLPVGIELPSLFSAIFVPNVEISEASLVLDSRPNPLRC